MGNEENMIENNEGSLGKKILKEEKNKDEKRVKVNEEWEQEEEESEVGEEIEKEKSKGKIIKNMEIIVRE